MTKAHDNCIVCGTGNYREFKKDLLIGAENDEQLLVPEVSMLRCDTCGDEVIPPRSHRYVDSYVADRAEQLSPDDVRDLFSNIDDTQSAICEDLGFGTKTLGRWLSGIQHPNRAMGFYLRVMAEFPQAYQWVKGRAWKPRVLPVSELVTLNIGQGLQISGYTFSDLGSDRPAIATETLLVNFADDFRNTSFSQTMVR